MIRLGRSLRALAVLIAVAGAIDPVFTWSRTGRPLVALVDAGASSLTRQLQGELARDFETHDGPAAGAAATVIVGRALPAVPFAPSGSLIAVTPDAASRRVDIERIVAPGTAAPASRVPVAVSLRAIGAAGRTLRVEVYAEGVLLDRATHAVAGNDERSIVRLSGLVVGAGVSRLVVRVRDAAADDAALTADGTVAVAAVDVRWKVLVVDPRPSWASTFVRRALEDDRRFDVASRVTTSTALRATPPELRVSVAPEPRAIEVATGAAPSLADAGALESFSAIVVGAPDALTAPEVEALEMFARRRGGAVVLLLDRAVSGPFARITGAASLGDVHGIERRKVTGDAGAMVATELAVPEKLSPGAEVLASTGAGAASRAAVWQTPLGAGRVVVSGALDAWRYRAREQNGFARFWSTVIADAAASAPPPVMVLPAERLAAAGTAMDVRVVVRRAQLSDPARPAPAIEVRARLAAAGATDDGEPLRLWPTPERGVFVAPVQVPGTAGAYRIAVDAFDDTGAAIGSSSADVVVGDTMPMSPVEDLAAWTTAHGGIVVPAPRAGDVASAIRAHVSSSAAPRQVHPMRSLWWLPVCVAALGGEWWLRRRRGER